MASVTIKDVAREANVSKKTVSRVLNNEPFVKEETRNAVLAVINRLGYRPSNVARSLSRNRTDAVGIVVSNIANNFIGEVIRGVEEVTRSRDYSLIVCNTDEQLEQENRILDLLLRQRVDGVIAAASSPQWETMGVAAKQQTPIVFLDRKFEGMEGPFVGVDNEGGAFLAVNHLINRGYKQIGVISGLPRLSTIKERLAGYQRAMVAHGLDVNPDWVAQSNLAVDEGRQAARQMLSQPERPEALFVATNLLALGTLLALKDLNLHCPDDVAIVAFDDHPWAEVCNPPLTVVRQPAREIGQTAAHILLGLIDGAVPDETQVQLASELIVRQSC